MGYQHFNLKLQQLNHKAGFFFTVAEKLKAKKTQALKKLEHFFSQKLKVLEDFSKSLAKNSISTKILVQNFIRKRQKVFLNLKKQHFHEVFAKT